jgi:hypothetical protein
MSDTMKKVLGIFLLVVVIGFIGFAIGRSGQDDPQSVEATLSIVVRAPGSFTINVTPKNAAGEPEVEVTKGTPVVFQISTAGVGGYDGRIHFSFDGGTPFPAGSWAFSANDVAPGTMVTLTIQTNALTSNSVYVTTLTADPN